MKHCCINKLLAPSYFLLAIDSFEQLLQSISLFLLFDISDNFNNCSVFLRNFDCDGFCVEDLDSEYFVSLFRRVFMLNNSDLDFLLTLLVSEFELAFRTFVVNSRLCLLVSVAHRHSFIVHFNVAVSSLNAVHQHDALVLVCGVPLRLLLRENQHARLIVVQNCHTRPCVLSKQSIASTLVVELNEEVLVRLPALVIDYIYFHFALCLTILESKRLVNCLIILTFSSITVLRPYVNNASSFGMVQNFDS